MQRALSKKIASLVTTTVLAIASQSAAALVAEVDEFAIWKNQALLFQDTFSDNVAPPSAPGEFATYLFPVGRITESAGKAYLDAAHGELRANAEGDLSNVTRITFSTNIVPSESTGLKSDQTFQVKARFGLLDNTVAGDTYGIRLTDRDALGQLGADSNSGNDVIELRVNHSATGGRRLQFRTQDFILREIDVLSNSTIPTSYFNTYDSVELILTKDNPGSKTISASAAFLSSGGTPAQFVTFSTTVDAFQGENWTRAELFASQAPIPEPETYAMLLTGVALIGWRLRRQARHRIAANAS